MCRSIPKSIHHHSVPSRGCRERFYNFHCTVVYNRLHTTQFYILNKYKTSFYILNMVIQCLEHGYTMSWTWVYIIWVYIIWVYIICLEHGYTLFVLNMGIHYLGIHYLSWTWLYIICLKHCYTLFVLNMVVYSYSCFTCILSCF